jgi:hypothetical protein
MFPVEGLRGNYVLVSDPLPFVTSNLQDLIPNLPLYCQNTAESTFQDVYICFVLCFTYFLCEQFYHLEMIQL